MKTEKNLRTKSINKVTLVGSFVNLLLSLGKVIAGIVGKSSAMLADGIHSLSDLITDIIVLVFVKFSSKDKDEDHHYGHGKFETFATMLISFALMIVGVGIFWTASEKIYGSFHGKIIEQPGIIALWAALISIVSKEALFWYTKIVGQKLNSQAVIANAWHHRSDAFSSIGTALGISGAIFLGDQWRILDPIAGIIVSFFIFKVAWKIGHPSIKELLESALPPETEKEIAELIAKTSGVKDYHKLRTRKIGEIIAVDVHVLVEKTLTVEASHDIAGKVEEAIREKYGKNSHIGVHIEPYNEPDPTIN
jgi:cation diffusion facilitator family transporter